MVELDVKSISNEQAKELLAKTPERGQYAELIASIVSNPRAVQVGGFKTQGTAWNLVRKARKAGFESKIHKDEQKNIFVVIAPKTTGPQQDIPPAPSRKKRTTPPE